MQDFPIISSIPHEMRESTSGRLPEMKSYREQAATARLDTSIYPSTYLPTYLSVNVYLYMYIYTHKNIYVCIYIYVQMY